MTNRMALICYRIAMILTVLRNPALHSGQQLHCHDADYHAAVAITNHLLQHSLHVYEQLHVGRSFETPPFAAIKTKEEQICEVCRQHKLNIPYSKIAMSIWGRITKKSTVSDWVRDYCSKAS